MVRGDHLVESTDVSVHVSPALRKACNMLLHIAAQALPFCAASTQRRLIMKVGMLRSETQEFVVIVNIFFGSVAKQEPQLSSLMARLIAQQPVQHGAKRRDARAG